MKNLFALLSLFCVIAAQPLLAQVQTFTVDNNTTCAFDIEVEWALPNQCSSMCGIDSYSNCTGTGCVVSSTCGIASTPAVKFRVRETGTGTWSNWVVRSGCGGQSTDLANSTNCESAMLTIHSGTYGTIDP